MSRGLVLEVNCQSLGVLQKGIKTYLLCNKVSKKKVTSLSLVHKKQKCSCKKPLKTVYHKTEWRTIAYESSVCVFVCMGASAPPPQLILVLHPPVLGDDEFDVPVGLQEVIHSSGDELQMRGPLSPSSWVAMGRNYFLRHTVSKHFFFSFTSSSPRAIEKGKKMSGCHGVAPSCAPTPHASPLCGGRQESPAPPINRQGGCFCGGSCWFLRIKFVEKLQDLGQFVGCYHAWGMKK